MFKIIPLLFISFYPCILLSQNLSIKGYVLNKSNGQPIKQALIYINGTNERANSDDEGYFELLLHSDRQAGKIIDLRIKKQGFAPLQQQTPISEKALRFSLIADVKKTPLNEGNTTNKKIIHTSLSNPKATGQDIQYLIDNLSSDDQTISDALSELNIEKLRINFNVKQIFEIYGYYNKYRRNQTIDGEVETKFVNLLSYISEKKNLSETEISDCIAKLNQLADDDDPMPIIKFIDKSDSKQVSEFYKSILRNRDIKYFDADGITGLALNRFLKYENLQPDYFYIDFINQFKNLHSGIFSVFHNVVFGLAPFRKPSVIKLLNNLELVDSFLRNGELNYESTLIYIRTQWREELSKYISVNELDSTYFFTLVCPCFLDKNPGLNSKRQLPCDSTKMYLRF